MCSLSEWLCKTGGHLPNMDLQVVTVADIEMGFAIFEVSQNGLLPLVSYVSLRI